MGDDRRTRRAATAIGLTFVLFFLGSFATMELLPAVSDTVAIVWGLSLPLLGFAAFALTRSLDGWAPRRERAESTSGATPEEQTPADPGTRNAR